MGFIEKIKLLFKIQKPLGELAKAGKDVKSGWKTLKFWITFTATLGSTAAALTGLIPAPAQAVAVSIINGIYNILRGAEKMESSDTKGLATTTEFWLTALTEAQKGIVAMEVGGINPALMTSLSMGVGALLAAGQNLASRIPPEGAKK